MPGYIRPDYELEKGEKLKIWMPFDEDGAYSLKGLKEARNVPKEDWKSAMKVKPEMKILNAREAQEQFKSKADFFKQFGFVCLKAETDVCYWNSDFTNDDNDITKYYHKEIEELISKELYPTKKHGKIHSFNHLNAVITRGNGYKIPGTKRMIPHYGARIHQDYGRGAQEYLDNLEAFGAMDTSKLFMDTYNDQKVKGCTVMNVWRPLTDGPC